MYQRILPDNNIITLNLTKDIAMSDSIIDTNNLKGKELTVWGKNF